MEQNLNLLRQEIVDKSLQAFREGLFSGTSGNMSCRVAPDEMLITPTSVRYDVLRAQDIVRMKLDGTVLEGKLQPSSEWRMHAAVYKAYGETNAGILSEMTVTSKPMSWQTDAVRRAP